MELEVHKKTKIIFDKDGHVLEINPDGSINVRFTVGDPVDAKSASLVPIGNTTYTELCRLTVPDGQTYFINELLVTLNGFSAHYKVEYFDGISLSHFRDFILNTTLPTFTESIPSPTKIIGDSTGKYIKVSAKMQGVNEDGQAFACITAYR